MPEARNQNRRIYGNTTRSYSTVASSNTATGLTEEQKAERQRETQANYERWRLAREARLNRLKLLRK